MPLPYRIFCFPHAGVGGSAYRNWGRLLGESFDVAAVRLPGREQRMREPLLHSVRNMVADVIDGIAAKAVEASAGFAIFGHSMGALIGYELTHALVGRGIIPNHLIVSGYRAPHLPLPQPWVHQLPTDELVRHLTELEGTSADILANPDMLEMMLPIIRADYEVCESYRYPNHPLLGVPMTAIGGDRDPGVAEEHMKAWGALTTGDFHSRIFPGGHFFLHDQLGDVLNLITLRTSHSPILLGIADGCS